MEKNQKFDGMRMESPASAWTSAIPLGNGTVGGLFFGGTENDRVILTHEKLFLPIDGRVELPTMDDCLPEIRRLLREGQYKEAAERFVSLSQERGLVPQDKAFTHFYPDPFIPAFELSVQRDSSKAAKKYSRGLDFARAEGFASWQEDDTSFCTRAFVSMRDNILAILYENDAEDGENLCLSLREVTPTNEKDQLYREKYIASCRTSTENDTLRFDCTFTRGGSYCGKAKIDSNGEILYCDNMVKIKNARKTTILLSLSPDASAAPSFPEECDYASLLARHQTLYRALYDGTKIELDEDPARSLLSNEMLLEDAKQHGVSPMLAEKLTAFGRCSALMSSGNLPPNAQGIWNGSLAAGMLADYITNIELEITSWQLMPGGLAPLMRTFLNYAESMLSDWRENARKFYGCAGILVSSRITNYGQLHHFSSGYPHMFWTAGAAWIARSFFEYYEYTGDMEYLEAHAYPFMKEAFAFYRDFLIPDDGYWNTAGKLCFLPSVSPENAPSNTESMASCNATMDIAAVRELCENFKTVCQLLHKEEDYAEAEALLSQLPPYRYNESGSLREWATERLDDSPDHRHISHLYPAYPSFEASRAGGRLKDGCQAALLERIQHNFLGDDAHIATACGWSLVHALNAAARLGMTESCKNIYDVIAKGFLHLNLWGQLTENGNIFQIDVNVGLPAAMYEMLLYSEEDRLVILPSLPERFSKGRAVNLHGKGGVLISELRWDFSTNQIQLCLKSNRSRTLMLKIPRLHLEKTISLTKEENWYFA